MFRFTTRRRLRVAFAFTFLFSAPVSARDVSSAASREFRPLWLPLLAPVSIVAPGTSHWLRGETETSKTLAKTAGISLGTLVGLGGLGAFSGAAYLLMSTSMPFLVLAGSTYLAAGSADFIGAFSQPLQDPNAPSLVARNIGRVASFNYLYVPNEIFDRYHYYRVGGEFQEDGHLLSTSIISDSVAKNVFYEGSYAYSVYRWGHETRPARLYLEVGGLHERNPESMFNATRLQTSVLTRIPLAEIGPTLSSAYLELSIGYQYRWTHYDEFFEAPTDYQSGVSGGFEIGWQVTERVHTSWGYEHSRDGFIGGIFTGYLGHFHAGGGLRLARETWLTGRFYAGKPYSLSIGLETAL